ncbi:hypothetical protein AT864_03124 [Anoxybacillus sp. P3H1B]|uniref:hypothetical protein n=1 Tax=Anoxybacillus sp. P3H1B TaxID=1769293 RepID=UPI0007937901|nr:hypothetical protein [Anoxybacillus sp. P3H1B]KXG08428.1 hypothetical protein AT864_03124 [Anoxybacillus sp. P3H1B]
MLQTSLSKAALEETARQLQREIAFPLHEADLKKGLKLYREGFVYNAHLLDSQTVHAHVLDEKVHQLTLHFTDLSQGRCECGAAPICSHRLALFFYLYANVGPVGELVRTWTQRQPSIKLAKASQSGKPSGSSSSWREQFEQAYHRFLTHYRMIDYWFAHHLCDRFFPSLLDKAPDLSVEKQLYHLHAALFTFEQLIEYSERFQRYSYHRSYWEAATSDFVSVIHNKCASLASMSIPAAYSTLLKETQEYVHSLLFTGPNLPDLRIRVYQTVWNMLVQGGLSTEHEQEKLQPKLEHPSSKKESLIALAHLAFLRRHDGEAFAFLKQSDMPVVSYLLFWLRELSHTRQWTRMKAWWPLCLDAVASLETISHHNRTQIIREVLHLLEHYTETTGDGTYYERMLQKLLPYSAYDYSHFLMASGQYKKWVDLHLIANMEIEDIHRSFLAEIEKSDRSLLLPLYHHGVQKMIQMKNRQAYKRAVKYLKKLRSYYRSLGKYHIWLEYRERLLAETKRMRAFYEEMQKGKLLND